MLFHYWSKYSFVDVDLNTFCICEKELEKSIFKIKIKKKVNALITVEVNGRSPNYSAINKIAKKYKFPIITDSGRL